MFYLLTFVTGIFALVLVNGRHVANLAGTACYVAVILLSYHLFKAVNRASLCSRHASAWWDAPLGA